MNPFEVAVEEGVRFLGTVTDDEPLRLPATESAVAGVEAARRDLGVAQRVRDAARGTQDGPTLSMLNAVCAARATVAQREAVLAGADAIEKAAIEKFWDIQADELAAREEAERAEALADQRWVAEVMTIAEARALLAEAQRIRQHTAGCHLPVEHCDECSREESGSAVECFWDLRVPAAEMKLAGTPTPART